jgi:hypothetical protein
LPLRISQGFNQPRPLQQSHWLFCKILKLSESVKKFGKKKALLFKNKWALQYKTLQGNNSLIYSEYRK